MLREFLLVAAIAALGACAGAQAMSVPPPAGEYEVALYKTLAREGGNQFVSPFSLSAGFSLLYPGARGATAQEVAHVFGYDASAELEARQARDLSRTLQSSGVLTIANAAWAERSLALAPEYLQLVRDELGATIESVDFQNNANAVRLDINEWAAQHTQNRIQDLLRPNAVDNSTRLVLTNAVYFKAAWEDPFPVNSAEPGDFHAETGGAVTARFMTDMMDLPYIENSRFQAVLLDYEGEQFAMAVFLPRENSSLRAFEERLTGARLRDWLADLNDAEESFTYVTMPRVRIESDYDLVPTLQSLGAREVFGPQADLSGLFVAAPQLHVDTVVQKTFLNIDEEGTEAAAATAEAIQVTGSRIVTDPNVFTADRPFFIVLFHKPTNTILFMGRVASPEAP